MSDVSSVTTLLLDERGGEIILGKDRAGIGIIPIGVTVGNVVEMAAVGVIGAAVRIVEDNALTSITLTCDTDVTGCVVSKESDIEQTVISSQTVMQCQTAISSQTVKQCQTVMQVLKRILRALY
jgi:hypothetical protein